MGARRGGLAVTWLCAAAVLGCPKSVAPCGPTNCMGCCDSTGSCDPGNAHFACGSGGGACVQCNIRQTCAASACVANPSDAGLDGGLDSGAPPDAGGQDGGADAGAADAGPAALSYALPYPPSGIAVDISGYVWISAASGSPGSAVLYKFAPGTANLIPIDISGGSGAGQAGGMTIDGAGQPWVLTAGVDGGGSLGAGLALVGFNLIDGGLNRVGNGDGGVCSAPCLQAPLGQPVSVGQDGMGQFWVVDTANGGPSFLTVLDPNGLYLRRSQVSGGATNSLAGAQIALDALGDGWAFDAADGLLIEVNQAGVQLHATPIPGLDASKLVFDGRGNLWAPADGGAPSRMVEIQTNSAVSAFALPAGVVVEDLVFDSAETMWIRDATSPWVWHLDDTGQLLGRYGPVPGDHHGMVGSAMAIDTPGNLWIAKSNAGAGILVCLPRVAAGPEGFPYPGPEFPF